MKMKKFIASVLVAATAFGLVACGNSGSGDSAKSDSSAKNTDKKEIVYGKSQGPYTELFEDAIVPILEKEGYTVKGVDLSDLQTADVALNDGDVDVNVEQHTAYMENFNKSYNGDLVAISPIRQCRQVYILINMIRSTIFRTVQKWQFQTMHLTQHGVI